MKPHPRIRKTVKWGGAAATVLLVVVWIGSGWWSASWYAKGWNAIGISRGLIELYGSNWGLAEGFVVMDHVYQMDWSFGPLHQVWGAGVASPVTPGTFGLPLWAVVAPITSITALAWRLDARARRRTKLNLCPKCNYDRTGLAAGAVCPECGSTPV